MPRILQVYWGSRLAGHLQQDDSGALSFSYEPDWQESGFPLSASLPLATGNFVARECRPFFAGLLPEQESRKLVAQSFGVSERNDFALLEKIGAECAGAVSLIPAGMPPPDGLREYLEISLDQLADRLVLLPGRPLLAGEDGIRLSLAGAQGKLAVAIHGDKLLLPQQGSPSTHIIKPESGHFEHLAENEYFCMTLARKVGLEVAEVELGLARETQFLQVKRYDRRGPNGEERIHQEDFCQALGLPPEMKYQDEGGPGLKASFELVRKVSTVPGPDSLKLFDAVVFNYLIGNCDAHGKNFSFLYEEGEARLAPLYDLVCTRAYPGISQTMAMKIGSEKDPDRLFAKNWSAFIDDIKFAKPSAIKRITDMTHRVLGGLDSIPKGFPGHAMVFPIARANCEALLLSVKKS